MAARQPAGQSVAPRQADEVRPQTWADPGTWNASVKFLPAYVALVAIFIAVYWNHLTDAGLDIQDYESCRAGFNYTFHVNAASSRAQKLAESAKDVAWAFEATQQIYDPQRSVFSSDPFPKGKVPSLGARLDEASIYFDKKVNANRQALYPEESFEESGSAAVGVPALMFGQKWSARSSLTAATAMKDFLLNAPTYHSAICSRYDKPGLRADAVGLFAPFLAYYGVAHDNVEIVRKAVEQVQAYRTQLVISTGTKIGLWRYTVGTAAEANAGAWSTANAVAAYGMVKVRATIKAWPRSNGTMSKEIDDLDFWIQEILDAVIEVDDDSTGLLRNYLGDSNSAGETSGTALLAATAYRMARLRPDVFAQGKYIAWAERKRHAVFARVDETGIVRPSADPDNARSESPVDISPEGESFLILLGTAWRDVICGGGNQAMLDSYFAETHTAPAAPPMTFESVVGYTPSQIFAAYRQHLRKFYGMLWKVIKSNFERTTGFSVDVIYAQAMEPVNRYAKYLSGPS